jgi:preprotein translocase subunit Sec63
MNQSIKISNRELRKMRAEKARSEALNRYLQDCQEIAKDARFTMHLWQGTLAIILLALLSTAIGWR